MNRRFAVLGLAVATFGTVVAGQTTQKDAPVAITPAPSPTGGFSNLYPRRPPADAQPQLGAVAFRVESVGPQRMRLYLTQNGVDKGTVESSGFTVTTGPGGTTITALGAGNVTHSGSTDSFLELEIRVAADGTLVFRRAVRGAQ